MELKAVKNETKKEYLTKKEQYQKMKDKAGKIGISTVLMFLASKTSYAMIGEPTMPAGVLPYETPVYLSITGLIKWGFIYAGIISLIITLTIAIINRKKEDVKKKIKKGLIITVVLWGMAVILGIAINLLKNQTGW